MLLLEAGESPRIIVIRSTLDRPRIRSFKAVLDLSRNTTDLIYKMGVFAGRERVRSPSIDEVYLTLTWTRIDKQIVDYTAAIWVVCPVRNEIAMLPDFMRHYRALGITRFCFIDNGSTDATTDYLVSQPDCVVFVCDESYRQSNFAVDWINRVIAELPIEGWLILADVDEQICYSSMEKRSAREFLHDCETQNADAVYGVMVDMYPADSFLGLRISPGDRLDQLMPYFDGDYVFRKWPERPWETRRSLQVVGGPRCRLLLSAVDVEHRRGWRSAMLINQVDRFVEFVPSRLMPGLARIWPREVPAQVKIPINFVRPGFRFINSHSSTNKRFANEVVSLLHYKFCSELQSRISMVISEGNHYRKGLSYLQLQQALADWHKPSLMYEGSQRLSSSADLDAVGLTGRRAAVVWQSAYAKEFRTSRLG